MPRFLHLAIPGALALCAACGSAPAATAAVTLPTGFVDQVIVSSGLDQPRAFATLPDGRMLVVEQRSGKVHLIVGNHIASTNPVYTVLDVNPSGYERGVQGIAVDPQFPARPYVYFFYDNFDLNMHLVRCTVSGTINTPTGESLTFGSERQIISNLPHSNPSHNGGCLRFGPDGMLYASVGDGEEGCTAQDSTWARGCFLRMDLSKVPAGGSTAEVPRGLITPKDNPLSSPDSNARLVWAYGFRNPWVFGMDPATGTIYTADVGEATQEEVDEVVKGRNYGWPYREGMTVQTFPGCTEPGGSGNFSNGYVDPIAAFDRDGNLHAVNCAGIYRAVQPGPGVANWPAEYRGNVFFADYYVGDLIRLKRDAVTNKWIRAGAVPGMADSAWARGLNAATDYRVGADGSLYWLSQFDASFANSTGSLHRIVYTGSQAGVPIPPASAVRLSCAPDPFVSHAELSFTLPVGGHASLALYDLLGRRVATLFNGAAAAGETRLSWDGADARGGRAANGVYLARLEAAGVVKTLRVLRVQ
jgi:glucose/arabinose dehydrogenase